MAQEMEQHMQDFAAQNHQGFPDSAALFPVVGVQTGKTTGVALQCDGHEVKDVAQQGVAAFGEAPSPGETARLVEGDVQAGQRR